MDERPTLEVIAPTVEEAISQGLSQLGLAADAVSVEVLDAGTKGLFGMGGRQVRVRLTVDMPREGWYMMVTDPLPAGFEAINYSLNTSGVEPMGKSNYYWSRPDLRDDRAVFFSTYMWKGKHVYTYLIRATSSGTFRALPAEVTPMYEPEVWGRSASAEFVVKP